jgi:hypothetical protein
VSAIDRRVQISEAEVWSMAKGECRRWPSGACELIVFVADVATVGHSMSKSTDGARSHRYLVNNRE